MRTPSLDDRIAATMRPTDQPKVMHQSWNELLFLHWEIDPVDIQSTLPEGLRVDTFDGRGYLGIVPFYMNRVRPPFFPAVPGLSNFLEMNVRTYVHDEYGRPGVWFYSLDANQKLVVRLARKFFHLPYYDAKMSSVIDSGVVDYRSQQEHSNETSCYKYSARSVIESPEPGSLEYFLAERYYLFSHHQKTNQLYSGRVHHTPYPLLDVEVAEYSDYPIQLAGFERPGRLYNSSLMSHGVNVEVFPLQKL